MKTIKFLSVSSLVLLVFLGSGCFTCAKKGPTQAQPDLSGIKQSLLDVDRQFSKLSVEKGMPAAFDYYMTDDAVILRNNAHPYEGRKVLRELLAKSPEGTLEWEPYFADVSASDDLGYTLGKFVYTYKDREGNEQKMFGYYVSIWKKQPDGSWKFVFDTGNQVPAPK